MAEEEKLQEPSDTIPQPEEFIQEENPIETEELTIETWSWKIIFSLPDSLEMIRKIATMIKENPWDIAIQVGNMHYQINQQWLQFIQELLW